MKSTFAACLLLLTGVRTSHAFNFSINGDGFPEHWSFVTPDGRVGTNSFNPITHAVRYYIARDVFSVGNSNAEVAAVRSCFAQWQSISNTVVKFEEAGFRGPGYDVNTSDDSNVVYWAKSSTIVNGGLDNISGALGVTFSLFTVPDNVIKQFDIVMNGVEHSWFTDFNDKNNPNSFIESTLLHELGHSLGLSHAANGGASLLWAGGAGVESSAGLSSDEVAFARALYPSGSILSTLGHLKGTVSNGLGPVFGAAVILEGTNGNLVSSTASYSDGTYQLLAVPPGAYNVRVTPLDPSNSTSWLIRGGDIASPEFDFADASFLPTTNTPVTLTAGTTNTLNVTVTPGDPAFRIAMVITPVASLGSGFTAAGLPVSMTPGQSNYFSGAGSESLPTNGATVGVSGNGITLGAPLYASSSGINFIVVPISVASNATPGLRTITVSQGTNRAYANGYLEIVPLAPDYNFDGLDDYFQRKYFLPFTVTNAAPLADPDGDGMNNFAENIAGTIPTNAVSLLKMQSVTVTNNGRIVRWQSVTGKRYQVSVRTNLVGATWQNFGAPVTAVSTTAQFLDTPITNTSRFYRVQVLP